MSLISIVFLFLILITGFKRVVFQLFDPKRELIKDKQKAIRRVLKFEEDPINQTIASSCIMLTLSVLLLYVCYDLFQYLRVLYNF